MRKLLWAYVLDAAIGDGDRIEWRLDVEMFLATLHPGSFSGPESVCQDEERHEGRHQREHSKALGDDRDGRGVPPQGRGGRYDQDGGPGPALPHTCVDQQLEFISSFFGHNYNLRIVNCCNY